MNNKPYGVHYLESSDQNTRGIGFLANNKTQDIGIDLVYSIVLYNQPNKRIIRLTLYPEKSPEIQQLENELKGNISFEDFENWYNKLYQYLDKISKDFPKNLPDCMTEIVKADNIVVKTIKFYEER
jgi:hypothetical protein